MATKYINTKFTLLDRAKQSVDGKKMEPVIRVMDEKVDDFFKDVPFIQANMGLQHRILRDTGMVANTKRTFYSGVKSSKQNTQVVFEKVTLTERRREIDEDLVDTATNMKEFLRQQDEAHARKLGEGIVNDFFNEAETSGSEFANGIFARLSALNPSGLNNVQSNSHSSTGTSLVVVEWNTDETGGCYGIYPPGWVKNHNMGVSIRDKGREKILDEDDSTKTFYAYVAQFKAWMGLAVGNNRKIARLANINPTIGASKAFTDGGPEALIKLLNDGRFDRARTRIYVNTTIKTQMEIYGLNKSNTIWGTSEIFGKEVDTFQKIPIRILDTTIISDSQALVA